MIPSATVSLPSWVRSQLRYQLQSKLKKRCLSLDHPDQALSPIIIGAVFMTKQRVVFLLLIQSMHP